MIIVSIKRHKWIICYLISIALFAILYGLMPEESFKYRKPLEIWDWAYFSVVTITTLGYGDITPLSGYAKLFVSFESLFGLFLLGMFLNGEAQNAIERRDKKYVSNALNHSFSMLAFVEEYFSVAYNEKSVKDKSYKERFHSVAEKLKYHPEKFIFTDHILENIYWGARHVVNDFRLLALDSKSLSNDAFSYVSTIITNLDHIENSPIDSVGSLDRIKNSESMQHKAYIVFSNAVILSEFEYKK